MNVRGWDEFGGGRELDLLALNCFETWFFGVMVTRSFDVCLFGTVWPAAFEFDPPLCHHNIRYLLYFASIRNSYY